ncbi:MAG: hypothetical protein NTW32_20870 [Chloroflexi bacterium]|nr:hypothetical protein [Chloroflexota bacterium]
MPTKNGIKIPMSSFIGYKIIAMDPGHYIDYGEDFAKVKYEQIDANTEFRQSFDEQPECYAVIEEHSAYAPEIIFVTKEQKDAQAHIDRRCSLLKALKRSNA